MASIASLLYWEWQQWDVVQQTDESDSDGADGTPDKKAQIRALGEALKGQPWVDSVFVSDEFYPPRLRVDLNAREMVTPFQDAIDAAHAEIQNVEINDQAKLSVILTISEGGRWTNAGDRSLRSTGSTSTSREIVLVPEALRQSGLVEADRIRQEYRNGEIRLTDADA